MTMPDPLGLRTFAYVLNERLHEDGEVSYTYEVRITRGTLLEYESPEEVLVASSEEAAKAEAATRTSLVMAMVQGGTVESLEPRGVGDDGQPT